MCAGLEPKRLKGASRSNLGRVPRSPSLPLPWWCNPCCLNHDKLTILMVIVYIHFSTFSMPGRGASTVGTKHMPRDWDELNMDIFSTFFELSKRLSSIYNRHQSSPVGTLYSWHIQSWPPHGCLSCCEPGAGCGLGCESTERSRSAPYYCSCFFGVSDPGGGQREGSPRPGHQSPLGIWNASQLTCNTRSYHASVNLFQFHCIEHWHSCRRGKKCNSDADISISRIFSARSIFKVCVHKQKCRVVQTCPLVSAQIQSQR